MSYSFLTLSYIEHLKRKVTELNYLSHFSNYFFKKLFKNYPINCKSGKGTQTIKTAIFIAITAK